MTKITYDKFSEVVYKLKLKNGLEVHLLPQEDPYYTTYVNLSIPFGSLTLDYEVDGIKYHLPPGSAHFMEHKIFAMPDQSDAFQHFSNLGVDANAMTSYHQTSYVFNATEHLYEALGHLLNMLDTPYFTDENVENERKIIEEELKMYMDDPHSKMQDKLYQNMYLNHTMKHDIGGTVESIKAIKKETLNQIYAHFYQANKRILVIGGHVDIKKMTQFLKTYPYRTFDKKTVKVTSSKETKRLVVKQDTLYDDVHMQKIMLGIKLTPQTKSLKDSVSREMLMSFLLNMLLGTSSNMYEALLNQKLINQNFYVNTTFEGDAENVVIFAESKHVHRLKNILIDYLTQGAYDVLNQDDFERYKKVYMGQFIFALNSVSTKTYLYAKYLLQKTSLFDVIDLMNDITYEDVLETLKLIQKRYISVLYYKKTKS